MSSQPQKPPRKDRRPSRRRWVLAALLVGLVAFYWVGKGWALREIENRILERARERGLVIGWKDSTWSPWQGLHMTDLTVKELGGKPVAEVDNVAVHFPVAQFIGFGERRSFWRVKKAKAVLHDEQGEVVLEDISLKAEARRGHVDFTRVRVRKNGVTASVTGQMITRTDPSHNTQPFILNLRPLRGTLAVLDVPEGGPFHVTGTFEMDVRERPYIWRTDLKGEGKKLVWKGVPLESAWAEGRLGSVSSDVRIDCKGATGSVIANLTRGGWRETPFVFQGTLKDAEGREDSFHGNYQRPVMTIERLEGQADLWGIAKGVPQAAEKMPEKLTVRKFPPVAVTDVKVRFNPKPVTWSIGSVRMDGGGVFVWNLEGNDLVISKVDGGAAYDGGNWKLDDISAEVLGGTVRVDGGYRDGVLRNGRVRSAGIRLGDVKQVMDQEEGRAGKGIITLDYKGSIDTRSMEFDGAGSVTLDDAPTFDVPLLEEVFELFRSIVPGMDKPREGKFEAEFTAQDRIVEVTKFNASGGTLNVNAKGTVNLAKKRVDGRARGKLTGIPGLVTSPLSRLLEMEVSGPYEDIHVRPLGPARLASGAASGTVDDVVDFVEEKGKVTGTVIKEGVKAPFRFLRDKAKGEEKRKE